MRAYVWAVLPRATLRRVSLCNPRSLLHGSGSGYEMGHVGGYACRKDRVALLRSIDDLTAARPTANRIVGNNVDPILTPSLCNVRAHTLRRHAMCPSRIYSVPPFAITANHCSPVPASRRSYSFDSQDLQHRRPPSDLSLPYHSLSLNTKLRALPRQDP